MTSLKHDLGALLKGSNPFHKINPEPPGSVNESTRVRVWGLYGSPPFTVNWTLRNGNVPFSISVSEERGTQVVGKLDSVLYWVSMNSVVMQDHLIPKEAKINDGMVSVVIGCWGAEELLALPRADGADQELFVLKVYQHMSTHK